MSRAVRREGFPLASVLRQGSLLGVRMASLGGPFCGRSAEIGLLLHARGRERTYACAHLIGLDNSTEGVLKRGDEEACLPAGRTVRQ